MEIAFPRCTAIDIRCIKYVHAFSSPVWLLSLLPNYFTKASVCGPNTPDVSTAMGANSCVRSKSMYLSSLRDSALAATVYTGALNRQTSVSGSKGVYIGHVPHQTLPRHPRNHRDTIWLLAVTSEHPLWLKPRRHVGGCQGAMDDIIQSSMPVVSSLAPSATQPVSAHDVHLLSAMVILMGAAQRCA